MVQRQKVGRDRSTVKPQRKDVSQDDPESKLLPFLQRLRGSNVRAFAMLEVLDNNEVTTSTSKHLRPYIDLDPIRRQIQEAFVTSGPIENAMYFETDPENVPDVVTGDRSDIHVFDPDTNSSHDDNNPNRESGRRKRGRPPKCGSMPVYATEPGQGSALISKDLDTAHNIPEMRQMNSLRICEAEKVKDFLYDRLRRLQQLSDKKIAKAWIKGICPKKQARFPYRNAQREREEGLPPEVPPWWPSTKVCRFREPDHVDRFERVELLYHLLTLRPEPTTLKAWNKEITEVNQTHVEYGWTAFLKELAPIDCLENVDDENEKENEKRRAARRTYLKDLYDLADIEERYKSGGGVPSDYQFQWDDGEVEKFDGNRRRKRAASVTVAQDQPCTPSPSSSGIAHGRTKRHRNGKDVKLQGLRENLTVQMSNFDIHDDDAATETDEPCAANQSRGTLIATNIVEHDSSIATDMKSIVDDHALWNSSRYNPFHTFPAMHQIPGQKSEVSAQHAEWEATTFSEISPNTSFNSLGSGQVSTQDPYRLPTARIMMPANHEYPFQQHQGLPAVRVQQVTAVPQPQFDVVPGAPLHSPGALVHVQGGPHHIAHRDSVYGMSEEAPRQPYTPAYLDHQVIVSSGPQHPNDPYCLSAHQQVAQAVHGLPLVHETQEPLVLDVGAQFEYAPYLAAPEFQAAPRNMRGFTGHSSGVGGGQPT